MEIIQHNIVLGLGSNLGESSHILNDALATIEQEIGKITAVASFYENDAIGFTAQTKFINTACSVLSELSPIELLNKLNFIETKFGRKEKSNEKYSSRTLDIDILYYDNLILISQELQIPHPRILERDFVLFPLNDIIPNFTPPNSNLTINQLFNQFDKTRILLPS